MATDAGTATEQQDAFDRAQEALEGLGAAPLDLDELKGVGNGRFTAGWKLHVEVDGGRTYTAALVLPASFPYELPRFAVLDAPPLLSWPHLEEGNLLCVLPPGTSSDPERPAAQVAALVNAGVRLLVDIVAGRLGADYLAEFTAYWRRGADRAEQKFISLLEPGGGHREVWVWRGEKSYVVAETEVQLRAWLTNRHGIKKTAPKVLARTLFLALDKAIPPDSYPRTAADLRKLFAGDAVALRQIARQALADGERDVVIGISTPTGAGLAAVTIGAASAPSVPGRSHVNLVQKGFRPGGRIPEAISVLRATSPALKVKRHIVERADHNWVHGRDHDVRQGVLKKASVLVVGCGSLGSSVAEILARAGVGRLTLVDGEVLDWTNASRHALGIDHVGEFKASALAQRMAASLPHLAGITGIDRHLSTGNADILSKHDLVVATTGVWMVDGLINATQQRQEIPSVLYAWLEPHAAAAHAVAVRKGGACLRCHVSGRGVPDLSVSWWPNTGTLPIPSCGGSFTPYGAVELAYAHAMVADEALDLLLTPPAKSRETVWVGRTSRWMALGGEVSNSWQESMGDPGQGGFLVGRPWPGTPGCPVCGGAS